MQRITLEISQASNLYCNNKRSSEYDNGRSSLPLDPSQDILPHARLEAITTKSIMRVKATLSRYHAAGISHLPFTAY